MTNNLSFPRGGVSCHFCVDVLHPLPTAQTKFKPLSEERKIEMYERFALLWPFFCEPLPLPTQHVVMMMDGRRRQQSGTVHGSVTIHLAHPRASHQHEQRQGSPFWCVQLLCSPVIINYVASLIDTVGSDGSKFHWITTDMYKAPCIPEEPTPLYKPSAVMHQPHLRDQYIFPGKCRCLWGEKGTYSTELQKRSSRGTRECGENIMHQGHREYGCSKCIFKKAVNVLKSPCSSTDERWHLQ